MHKKKLYIIFCFIVGIKSFPFSLNDYIYKLNNNSDVRLENNVIQRLIGGFRLQHPQNDIVKYYEKLYIQKPKLLKLLLKNATPYIYYILTQTERNGLPSEIALIPAIESFYNPKAISNTNAFGLWQFMKITGKRFKLNKFHNVDDRKNIIKSTNAAIKYFKYLYSIFGQWEPAIGAYNCGEGNMYRAIVKSKYHLGSVDYYNLTLNKETYNYLPQLIALASIIEEPSKFNLQLNEINNQPYFALVNPINEVSIEDLINQCRISKSKFFLLNPQYEDLNQLITTNENILLPIENKNNYYSFNHIPFDQVNHLASDDFNDPIFNFIKDHDNNNDNLSDFIDNKLNRSNDISTYNEHELDKLIEQLD